MLWAEHACAWGVELSEDLYDDLLTGSSRVQAAGLPRLPAHRIPGLAADADPQVRTAACARWEELAAPLRARLLADTRRGCAYGGSARPSRRGPYAARRLAALPDPRRALEQCRLSPE
ncbi:hypothetical protein ABZ726_12420 [Streptomyces hundungensis]|uniref:hypothetical protein n=1 Tax=Streptomyces hundungensis TaxID=1077946 RepID=UPI0033EADC39